MLPSIPRASSLLELVIPGIFISVLETQLTISASMNYPHVTSNKLNTNERAHDLHQTHTYYVHFGICSSALVLYQRFKSTQRIL